MMMLREHLKGCMEVLHVLLLRWMCSSGLMLRCSDAPDTSGINRAAEDTAAISKEALDFYKQAYEDQAPLREQAAKDASAISAAQLEAMRNNTEISQDYYDYQTGTFRPLEKGIVEESENFDTPARREAAAREASADVIASSAAARAAADRSAAMMGVNPNSGRAMAMRQRGSVSEAALRANAMNSARKGIETQGWARKMDAASLGRGLASNQATSAGVALNAGNSASGNAQVPLQVAQQGVGMMGQGYNNAVNANQSAGNLYGSAANMQNQANANQWAGIGNLTGMGLAYFSDEDMKHEVKESDEEEALESIAKTDVKRWKYDPAKGGPDDGMEHTGPMAQDVRKNMGEAVAPGGKVIDAISMNGVMLQGIKAMNKKVDKLASQVAQIAATRGMAGARSAA